MTYRRLLEDGASRLLQEDGASFQLAEQDGVPAALAGASVGGATSTGALTTAGSFPWTAVPSFGGAVQGAASVLSFVGILASAGVQRLLHTQLSSGKIFWMCGLLAVALGLYVTARKPGQTAGPDALAR